MSYWYQNKNGFPKVSIRERINSNNIQEFQKEILEIKQIENDINKFYPLCKVVTQGFIKNLVPNTFSKDLLNKTNSKFNLVLKDRQVGCTCTLSVIALYNALFLNKNVAIISYDLNNDINILERILNMYLHLEEHLKYGVNKLSKKEVSFNNGTSIKIFSNIRNYKTPCELLIIDEYDFINFGIKKELITNIFPIIASRVGDKSIITSSINKNLNNKEYSVEDLITNDDYEIFDFNILTMHCFDSTIKKYNRDKKINEILNEKS
jgi:hypothetical protein